jgi:predicted Zn-dependent peptidase
LSFFFFLALLQKKKKKKKKKKKNERKMLSRRLLQKARGLASPALRERNPALLTTLDNGLKVASQAGASAPGLACLTVSVAAGTRHEGGSSTGAAHALEHAIHKGTTTRSREAFDAEVEAIGANVTACTSREITQFAITLPSDKLDKGFDLLSDILLRPTLSAAALEAEKPVIDQEWDYVMKQYPEETLYDHLHAVAFAADSSGLGYNILGDNRSYRSLTAEDLVNYRDAHYVAPRMAVTVAGAADHARVAALAASHFGDVPASAPRGLAAHVPGPVDWQGGEVRVHNDDMDHLALGIAWQGPGAAHEETVPLVVLQGMLAGYARDRPGSRLTANKLGQAARGNPGVEGPINAQSIDFFSVPYSDVVSAVAGPTPP